MPLPKDISRALAVGDHATGTSVLTDLYQKMGEERGPVNLSLLWKQLGIDSTHGIIVFDDDVPLAGIRQKITSPDLRPASTLKYR